MKKFSVLLVAILALMMLFVSCENEPKERAATMKDGEIVTALYYSAIPLTFFPEEVKLEGGKVEILDTSAKFTGAECECYNGKKVILNGTLSWKLDEKSGSFDLNLGTGTKYNGDDHTLLANVVMKMEKGKPVDVDSYEIVLDGVVITDFDFDFLSFLSL